MCRTGVPLFMWQLGNITLSMQNLCLALSFQYKC